MAQVVRMGIIDVFKEAQHAGQVPPGYKPGTGDQTTPKQSDAPAAVSRRMESHLSCSRATSPLPPMYNAARLGHGSKARGHFQYEIFRYLG